MKAIALVLPRHFLMLFLLACAIALAGCASTGGNDQQTQIVEQLAIQYAVMKVVDNDPDKAARVSKIAHDAKTWLVSDTATIDVLEAAVREQIDWTKLDQANTLLVNALLAEVDLQLRSRVSVGVLTSDQKVQVNQVLDWIIAVTG